MWKTIAQLKVDKRNEGGVEEAQDVGGTNASGGRRGGRPPRLELVTREEFRENQRREYRNQSKLGKAMSTIMKALLCSSRGEDVDERALSKAIELEAPPGYEESEDASDDDSE